MNMLRSIIARLRQPGVIGVVRAVLVVAICLGGLLMAAHIYAVSGKTKISPIASLDSQCSAKGGVMLGSHCIRQSALIVLKK